MQQLTTIPMPGMIPAGIRPPAFAPAPYRPGPSPFISQPRPRMGQIFGSKSLFDHPAIALAVDAGAISIALLGMKQFKSKTWRGISLATLVVTGIKAVNDVVRLFTMPGPAPSQTSPEPSTQPSTGPATQSAQNAPVGK